MIPNPQQQQVIDHVDGPCLVTAVPGAGKTASITERIKNLVQKGVDPRQILAITFTNKAADEMRSRIGKAVGKTSADKMTVCTFHSLCARIIRHNAILLDFSDSYTIYDTDDQERLLKTCIAKIEGEQYKPTRDYMKGILGYIEGKRNSCMTHQAAADKYQLQGNMTRVTEEYFTQLKNSNAIDFTGLLSEVLRLFSDHPEIRDRYRNRFKYISVDEVQDTNIAQYELIKHLALGHKNIVVVGDLDQSVYGWRGAFPQNILQFEKDFESKTLMLEQNYRSTPSILRYSQKLIDHNNLRKPTQLRTENPDGDCPRIIAGNTDEHMAALIASETALKISRGIKPCEIAIFYRTNYASRVLETAMRDRGIKYIIVGGLSFWHRKEVKIGLAFLKLLANENDRMSFEKVCEHFCKGAGGKMFSTIGEQAQTAKSTMIEAAKQITTTSKAANKALSLFLKAWGEVSNIRPGHALLHVSQSTLFWERLKADSTNINDRCENISEMAIDVDKYCSRQGCTLSGYLQTISLLTAEDADKNDQMSVKLMTMHACKGLEFDVVCISHCNEELLPHARSVAEARTPEELEEVTEEERRLLYVGMTRARKHLSLYFMRTKTDMKTGKTRVVNPSKFLIETGIPNSSLYNKTVE